MSDSETSNSGFVSDGAITRARIRHETKRDRRRSLSREQTSKFETIALPAARAALKSAASATLEQHDHLLGLLKITQGALDKFTASPCEHVGDMVNVIRKIQSQFSHVMRELQYLRDELSNRDRDLRYFQHRLREVASSAGKENDQKEAELENKKMKLKEITRKTEAMENRMKGLPSIDMIDTLRSEVKQWMGEAERSQQSYESISNLHTRLQRDYDTMRMSYEELSASHENTVSQLHQTKTLNAQLKSALSPLTKQIEELQHRITNQSKDSKVAFELEVGQAREALQKSFDSKAERLKRSHDAEMNQLVSDWRKRVQDADDRTANIAHECEVLREKLLHAIQLQREAMRQQPTSTDPVVPLTKKTEALELENKTLHQRLRDATTKLQSTTVDKQMAEERALSAEAKLTMREPSDQRIQQLEERNTLLQKQIVDLEALKHQLVDECLNQKAENSRLIRTHTSTVNVTSTTNASAKDADHQRIQDLHEEVVRLQTLLRDNDAQMRTRRSSSDDVSTLSADIQSLRIKLDAHLRVCRSPLVPQAINTQLQVARAQLNAISTLEDPESTLDDGQPSPIARAEKYSYSAAPPFTPATQDLLNSPLISQTPNLLPLPASARLGTTGPHRESTPYEDLAGPAHPVPVRTYQMERATSRVSFAPSSELEQSNQHDSVSLDTPDHSQYGASGRTFASDATPPAHTPSSSLLSPERRRVRTVTPPSIKRAELSVRADFENLQRKVDTFAQRIVDRQQAQQSEKNLTERVYGDQAKFGGRASRSSTTAVTGEDEAPQLIVETAAQRGYNPLLRNSPFKPPTRLPRFSGD